MWGLASGTAAVTPLLKHLLFHEEADLELCDESVLSAAPGSGVGRNGLVVRETGRKEEKAVNRREGATSVDVPSIIRARIAKEASSPGSCPRPFRT